MVKVDDAARLVALNGGQIVGKTRLQKSAYFLEIKQLGFGIQFSYHHFGPYSDEFAEITDDAVALKILEVDWRTSQAGAKYAVYSTPSNSQMNLEEQDEQRKRILGLLSRYSAIELELAATADFLAKNGYERDPWSETLRRKASKANSQRVKNSQNLLDELSSL